MSALIRVVTMMVLASAATITGCGSSENGLNGAAAAGGTGGTPDGGGCGAVPGDHDAALPDAAPPDHGDCQAMIESHPIEGAQHAPVCSPLTFGTNPPSSGNHYAIWADYRTYDRPFPRGFWVHSLEHGAVVITYNCPEGCAAEVADAQAFIDGLPADLCGPGAQRAILTPDPELDVRFAASAWGYTLRANCFDRDAFSSFYGDHSDHGPESICGGGTDPTNICGTSACP